MALQPFTPDALPNGSWGAAYAGLFVGVAAGRWRGLINTVTLAERHAASLSDPANLTLVSLTPAIAVVSHDHDFAGCSDLPVLSACG